MAKTELSHLHPAARALAGLEDDERILALQRDRWIDYPRAADALRRLERLLQTPERERMPCMVMHGPSNIGKTLIIAKFLRDHPPQFDDSRGVERRPVLVMQIETSGRRRWRMSSGRRAQRVPRTGRIYLRNGRCSPLSRRGSRTL